MDEPDHAEPARVGERDVEQARIRLVHADGVDRLAGTHGRGHDLVPLVLQRHREGVDQQPVVVADDQPHDATALAPRPGRTMRASAPGAPPGRGVKVNSPPLAETRAAVMVRPIDVCAGTLPRPGPSSSTTTWTWPPSSRTSTVTEPWGPAALIALSRMQPTARPRATGGTKVSTPLRPVTESEQSAVGSARSTQPRTTCSTSTTSGRSTGASTSTSSIIVASHRASSRMVASRRSGSPTPDSDRSRMAARG